MDGGTRPRDWTQGSDGLWYPPPADLRPGWRGRIWVIGLFGVVLAIIVGVAVGTRSHRTSETATVPGVPATSTQCQRFSDLTRRTGRDLTAAFGPDSPHDPAGLTAPLIKDQQAMASLASAHPGAFGDVVRPVAANLSAVIVALTAGPPAQAQSASTGLKFSIDSVVAFCGTSGG